MPQKTKKKTKFNETIVATADEDGQQKIVEFSRTSLKKSTSEIGKGKRKRGKEQANDIPRKSYSYSATGFDPNDLADDDDASSDESGEGAAIIIEPIAIGKSLGKKKQKGKKKQGGDRERQPSEKTAQKKGKPGTDKEQDMKRKGPLYEYEIVLKRFEELKAQMTEMGITLVEEQKEISSVKLETKKKGPQKKKPVKKKKEKMTPEKAEKAKQEMEAQLKKMEELIKIKAEENFQVAIEQNKKEAFEQNLRIEQLNESKEMMENVMETMQEKNRKEKAEQEWQKYIECGPLPNPIFCNQMNTYIHLWEKEIKNAKLTEVTKRTNEVIQLLNELEHILDTEEANPNQLENWKWIRQEFRNYQAINLDYLTYRLLRDIEHNLNRINIPTADLHFEDDHMTLCLWLRVVLPEPLPNPRRPPKQRIDVSFNLMETSILFPNSLNQLRRPQEDGATDIPFAIRVMYLKYDHLSDLCENFHIADTPIEFSYDLIKSSKNEWKTRLIYQYKNRDRTIKQQQQQQNGIDNQFDLRSIDDFGSDVDVEMIPKVPFQQLKPSLNEYVENVEDELYRNTRVNFCENIPEEHIINLRKFVILGGVYHIDLLAQPPQPQDFVTMNMTLTTLYLPKQLEYLPFKVIYTPYIPPELPEKTTESSTSIRKMPEELEEEQKRQEEELDKLISIDMKWSQDVIFLELPIVCRWNDQFRCWSKEEIFDLRHNEDKCHLSFRTGVFGIYALSTLRYANLPFQAYDIKPEIDDSVTIQLTAAILMLEFNIKNGRIAITQLQNSPNQALQNIIGIYFNFNKLKKMMQDTGIDIFPEYDAFCYINGCCEKQWPMEKQLYNNIAQMANSFNFSWSRWNLQAGRRKIVLQMRHYQPETGKQKNHQMLLLTPLKATFIDCTEVSQTFSEKEIDSVKFSADLFHLMKATNGIFIRNNVMKSSKENVYILSQFLISTRILSFS